MNGERSKRPHWNRREVLQTGLKGGAAAMAAAYGLRPDFALAAGAQRIRRHQVPAQGARAQSQARRRAALRHHLAAHRISTCISRAPSTASAARAACSTISSVAIRATAARPSFPISPTAGRSPRTARPTPSSCARTCSSTTAPSSRPTTSRPPTIASAKPPAGISIPRSILFSSVSEINVRDKHTIEFKLAAAAARQLHHVGLRQRLERHLPQEDAGGQSVQPAARRRHSRHRPLQEQAAGRERSLGDGAQPELLEQGGALSRRPRVLPRRCRSRRSSARPSCRAARTTRASSTRSPRARPRKRPACPRSTTIRA